MAAPTTWGTTSVCSQGELPIPTSDGCVCDRHLPCCAGMYRYPGKPHHIVTIENLWRVEGTGECVSGDVCCGTTIPSGDTDVRTYMHMHLVRLLEWALMEKLICQLSPLPHTEYSAQYRGVQSHLPLKHRFDWPSFGESSVPH